MAGTVTEVDRPTPHRPLLGAALVLGAASTWGTLGLFGKALYAQGLSAMDVASGRAAVGLLGLVLWFAPHPARLRVRRRDLPLLAAYGIIGYALFESLYFLALDHTTVAIAAAMLYTAPAFVVLLSWATRDEAVDARQLPPLMLVLLGAFLVTGALRSLLTGAAAMPLAATLLTLSSGLTYGLFSWFGKRAVRAAPPAVVTFYVFLFAALALCFFAPPWRIALQHPHAIPMLLVMGLGPTLGAYILYTTALHHLRASTASMLASVEPVVAAILAWLLLGEGLSWDRAAGIGLIVGASALLARGERRGTVEARQ